MFFWNLSFCFHWQIVHFHNYISVFDEIKMIIIIIKWLCWFSKTNVLFYANIPRCFINWVVVVPKYILQIMKGKVSGMTFKTFFTLHGLVLQRGDVFKTWRWFVPVQRRLSATAFARTSVTRTRPGTRPAPGPRSPSSRPGPRPVHIQKIKNNLKEDIKKKWRLIKRS